MRARWNRRQLLFALGAAPGIVALGACDEGPDLIRPPGGSGSAGAPTSLDALTPEYVAKRQGETRRHADRAKLVMGLLDQLADEECSRFPVSEQFHARQTATRAFRDDPGDEELVVAALCHDAGSLIGEPHASISAKLLTHRVRDDLVQVIRRHSVFQRRFRSDAEEEQRERYLDFRDEPWFDLALRFTGDFDRPSFDPDYDTLPLRHFEPLVRRIFGGGRHYSFAMPPFPAVA